MTFHNSSNAFHDDSSFIMSSSAPFSSSSSFDFGGHSLDDHLNSLLASDPSLASFPSSSSVSSSSFSSSFASSSSLPSLIPSSSNAQPAHATSHAQHQASLSSLMPTAADHLIASLLGDDLMCTSPTAGSSSSAAPIDPAKLAAAGLPADFEADLFALFGFDSVAPSRQARMPTPAPEDLPALEPPSPKAKPAAPVAPARRLSQPTPAHLPTAPSFTVPVMQSQPQPHMVPMLSAPQHAHTHAHAQPQPQLYSVINVTGPNNQPTTLLVPVSAAPSSVASTPSAAMPTMFASAAPPTSHASLPNALPAVAQTAAASLSAYHQHRLQEAAAAAAAAAAASAGSATKPLKPNSLAAAVANASATTAAAGLKPLLPAVHAAPVPVAKKPECNKDATATSASGAKRAKLEIPDDVLEYPSHLIPLDAPIQKKRKRSSGGDVAATATGEPELDADEDDASNPEAAKRIKNTLSARHSRARRAAKMNFLEARVVDLEAENDALKRELDEARRIVSEMKAAQQQQQVSHKAPMLARGMPPRI